MTMERNLVKLHNKETGRVKYVDKQYRPIGENVIKTEMILSAWLSYRRESRIYRILEFFGLR